MTIRFTCAGCGSLLKIKDDLAGTDGKCPKCKTEFVVPEPEVDEDSAELLVMPEVAKQEKPEKTAAKRPEKVTAAVKLPEKPVEEEQEAPEEEVAEPVVEKPSPKPIETPKPVEAVRSIENDKNVEKVVEKPTKPAKPKKPAGKDFDPADFLMEDGPKRPVSGFDDLSDPDDDRPAPETRSKKPAAKALSSGTMTAVGPSSGGVSASAHAKEMMMKAMEESRLHAGDPVQEEEKGGFDFAGMFRELGLKGGLGVIGIVILSYGMYLMFDRMMGSRLKLPPLGYVSGVVKLDGQPLPNATVYFAPLEAEMAGSKRDRARTSFGITDAQGHYKLIYIERTQGVAIGKCRVWLDLVSPAGQVIPPDHTEATMQVREVKSGSQEFNFDLKSPPRAGG